MHGLFCSTAMPQTMPFTPLCITEVPKAKPQEAAEGPGRPGRPEGPRRLGRPRTPPGDPRGVEIGEPKQSLRSLTPRFRGGNTSCPARRGIQHLCEGASSNVQDVDAALSSSICRLARDPRERCPQTGDAEGQCVPGPCTRRLWSVVRVVSFFAGDCCQTARKIEENVGGIEENTGKARNIL